MRIVNIPSHSMGRHVGGKNKTNLISKTNAVHNSISFGRGIWVENNRLILDGCNKTVECKVTDVKSAYEQDKEIDYGYYKEWKHVLTVEVKQQGSVDIVWGKLGELQNCMNKIMANDSSQETKFYTDPF